MRKFIIFLLIVCAIVYFGSGFILETLSGQAIKYLLRVLPQYGVEVSEPSFKSAGFSSFNAIAWKGVSGVVIIRRRGSQFSGQGFNLKSEKVELVAENPFRWAFLLNLYGLDIFRLDEYGSIRITDRIYGNKVGIHFQLDSITKGGLASIFRGLFNNLVQLLQEGRCSIPIEFSGMTTLVVKGIYVEARVYSQREGGQTLLLMNKEDLWRISKELEEKDLTRGDIGMLSRNPIRTPRLLQIRDKARSTARRQRLRNSFVPEDAYRHVLWSYLLTKEYGPAFAEEATDAHEVGSDNTRAESAMDYHNNAIGRRYAIAGYSESSILGRVMSDPAVIRSPR